LIEITRAEKLAGVIFAMGLASLAIAYALSAIEQDQPRKASVVMLAGE
jgi:hypothetical protein